MNTDTSHSLSPLKAARRDKILEVAEQLFVLNGLRATTMESVAAAVGMSKVTVYGYFNDKDALFTAVADRLAKRLMSAVLHALGGQGQPEERIANALIEKHRIIFQVVRSSAFSDELFAAKNRHVAEIFQKLDDEITTAISNNLTTLEHSQKAADTTAKLLFGASTGIANHARDISEASTHIERMVFGVLGRKPV